VTPASTSPGTWLPRLSAAAARAGAVAHGGHQRGQHQYPGEGEGGRVAGVDHEHAEHGGAGAVAGVVGQVPQRAGRAVAGDRRPVDHQREGGVLADPEAGPEQEHARDQDGRRRHPDQDAHPGGGRQQPGTSRPAWPCRSPWRPAHHRPPSRPRPARTARARRCRRTPRPASGRNAATTRPTRSSPRRPARAAAGRRIAGWPAARPAAPSRVRRRRRSAGPASQGDRRQRGERAGGSDRYDHGVAPVPASQTPDGRATMAGTQATTPARPIPSPRRSGGSAVATGRR
jgi:hypothetical protein